MNVIEIDNIITKILRTNIEIFKNVKYRWELYNSLDLNALGGRLMKDIKKDLKFIDELKFSENILFFYKLKTDFIIKEFLQILRTPINNNIFNSEKYEKKKRNIFEEYFNKIKMCIPFKIFERILLTEECSLNKQEYYCENCENNEEFIKEGDVLICKRCFSEIIKMAYYNNRSYNLSINKCNYDRVGHFKECLKQYQGKQNTFVEHEVYLNIENALCTNSIIDISIKDQAEKYKKVKKSHIMYFLKALGYSKHYDDCILIHHNLTGKKANNISHLEDVLISDFEKVSEKYSQLFHQDRKNFINIQFILYRLLIRHKYDFDPEDFTSIKSTNKIMDRDIICKQIFESLSWDYNQNK